MDATERADLIRAEIARVEAEMGRVSKLTNAAAEMTLLRLTGRLGALNWCLAIDEVTMIDMERR